MRGNARFYHSRTSAVASGVHAALPPSLPSARSSPAGHPLCISPTHTARHHRERARHVVLFGAAADTWAKAFRGAGCSCEVVETVSEATALAWSLTEAGDVVLFSPAAASFDAYKNFRARAMDFRACVDSLAEAAPSS